MARPVAVFLGIVFTASIPHLAAGEEVPTACSSMVKAIGAPAVVKRLDRQVLCRKGYVLSHDNQRKTPNWVVERLVPARFDGPGDRKELGDPFAPDPDLDKGKRAELADYRSKSSAGRTWDRGHMAPAASMKFSEEAMTESFYLSNMTPQQGPGLNRSIWADLEAIVRDWTCDRGELYVITGPIYDDDPPDHLGPDDVAVPTAFFKVAFDPSDLRAIAFVLPNQKVDKKGKPAWQALQPYIVSVREVEDRAGVRILSALTRRDRQRLSALRSVMWPVRDGCPN